MTAIIDQQIDNAALAAETAAIFVPRLLAEALEMIGVAAAQLAAAGDHAPDLWSDIETDAFVIFIACAALELARRYGGERTVTPVA